MRKYSFYMHLCGIFRYNAGRSRISFRLQLVFTSAYIPIAVKLPGWLFCHIFLLFFYIYSVPIRDIIML